MVNKLQNPRYDACPVCGSPKRKVAQTCKKCSGLSINRTGVATREIDWELLTPEWLAEFRGLFWGEGSALIVQNNGSYTTVVSIKLREDDREVIEDLHRRLGGNFLYFQERDTSPNRRPQYQWRVTRHDQVLEVCRLLLQDVQIPAKKVSDVQHVLSFLEWRMTLPRYFSEEDRQEMHRRFVALRESRNC